MESNNNNNKAKLGVIVPLFVSPQVNEAAWVQVASITNRFPRVHVVVVVDINEGPGLGPDTAIQQAIGMLKNNGVTVVGYIRITGIGSGPEEVKQAMKNWRNWYKNNIDGFYLAGVSREDEGGNDAFYQDVVSYAKDYLETKFIVAEFTEGGTPRIPKALVDKTHINLFISYKGRGMPAPLSALSTGHGWSETEFPSHRFGIISSKIPIAKQFEVANFIRSAVSNDVAQYFYFHTDSGARDLHPEPFTFLSEFFELTVRTLDQIAVAVAEDPNTPPPIPHSKEALDSVKARLERLIARETIPPEEHEKDLFGVEKIYEDVSNKKKKQEWLLQQDKDPVKDPRLKRSSNDIVVRRMQDGSMNTFYVEGDDEVRLQVQSLPNRKWLNTETTLYFKYLGNLPNRVLGTDRFIIQLFVRSGDHHVSKDPCQAACYKVGVMDDGQTILRKEVARGFDCPNRSMQPAYTAHELKDKWVGLKFVIYNIHEDGESNIHTRLQVFVDQNCTDEDGNLVMRNDWHLTSKFIDRGIWGLEDADKEKELAKLGCNNRKSTDILNSSGGSDKDNFNYAVFSSDRVRVAITNFSVREIQVPETD